MLHIESDLEKQCRAYARTHGCVAWKNEKNGNKGIPDDSFLTADGRFFMVEFKSSKNARKSPEQLQWQVKFPEVVFFVSSFNEFATLLQRFTVK